MLEQIFSKKTSILLMLEQIFLKKIQVNGFIKYFLRTRRRLGFIKTTFQEPIQRMDCFKNIL